MPRNINKMEMYRFLENPHSWWVFNHIDVSSCWKGWLTVKYKMAPKIHVWKSQPWTILWGRHTESSSDPPTIVLEIAKIKRCCDFIISLSRDQTWRNVRCFTLRTGHRDIVWHSRWESQQSQNPWRRKRMHRPQHPRRSVGFLLPLIWDPNHWDISLGYFAKLIWYLPQSGHLKRENVYYNDYDYYDPCCCYDCSYPLKFQTNLSTKRSRLWYPNAKGGKPHQ